MKTTFDQALIRKPTRAFFLVQDEQTKQFLIQKPLNSDDDEYNDDIYSLPFLSVDDSEDLALKFTKFFHSLGLSLNAYRELARISSVDYSLADETPGELTDNVCYLVSVSLTSSATSKLESCHLDELHDRLKGAANSVVNAGIGILI